MAKEDIQNSASLLRQQLASVDFDDIKRALEFEEKLTEGRGESSVKSRAGACETFYNLYFKDVLKIMIWEQLNKLGTEATDNDIVQFARGTLNGIFIVDEWCREKYKESLSRFDKTEGMPDLTGLH